MTGQPAIPPRSAYALAVLVTLAALIGLRATSLQFADEVALDLLLLPIIFSAYVGGLGPGLVATGVAAGGGSYWFWAPAHSATLMLAGTLISVLNEALHRSGRRIQAALHDQVALQEQLAMLTATAPGVILSFRLRPDGTSCCPYASPTIKDIYGLRPDQLVEDASAAFTLTHPDDIARLRATIAESARTLSVWREEFRVLNPVRGEVWVEGHTAPTREPDGSVLWYGFITDVTERKRVERTLRDSEERFALALRGANDGLWEWDLRNGDAYYSPRWKSMLGYAEDELENKPDTWVYLIHPDDLQPVLNVMRDLVAQRSEKFEIEFRARHKDGHYRDILSRGFLAVDAHGEVLRLVGTHVDISDRKRAEEALRESRERYRSLFENMLEGYAYCRMVFEDRVPSDFLYLDVNYAFERLTGLQNVVGKKVSEVVPGIQRSNPELFATYGRVAVTGKPERFETYVGPLGIWFSISVYSPREGEFVVVFDNITERKCAEGALRESQTRLAGIIDSAIDGIITIDEEERILVFNAAAERIFHCAAAEVLGQTIDRFIPQRFRVAHHAHLRRFGEIGGPAHSISEARRISGLRANGDEFPIEASVSRTQANGHMLLTIILRDITERVRSEATRVQLEHRLRLAQKMEALGTLAGGVAHDFNNILGAIIGNVELAVQDVGPGHPAGESLDEIRNASHRAKELVRRILAFSRQQPQSQSVITLRPVVDEAVRLLRASLPAGVALTVTVAPDTPPVLADATQIEQVLVNLCTNAWHALEGASGRIVIGLDGVTSGAEAAEVPTQLAPGRWARLTVTDTGGGMDSATLERIFEPFFTTKPPGKGTGLGLSVVHGIVKAHGGDICVDSRPGGGTTFTVYFPAAAEPAQAAPQLLPPPAPCKASGDLHVLYVDDEEALVFLVMRALERLGYRVSGYTQAEAALAAVRADPGQFDLVVTDLNMPGVSGLDVAREVGRLRPDLPVVLASGYITEELRAEAPRAGVRHLVYKPNTVEELCAVVQRVVGARQEPHAH